MTEANTEAPKVLTFEDLKTLTETLLRSAVEILVEDKHLQPVFVLVFDDKVETVSCDDAFRDAHTKAAFFCTLRSVCRARDARAFAMVTDTVTLYQTEEQERRVLGDKAIEAEFLRIGSEGGVAALAAAGYGRLMEAITVSGQTPKYVYNVRQMYERVAADGVIPASANYDDLKADAYTIRYFGEPDSISSESSRSYGPAIKILYEGAPI